MAEANCYDRWHGMNQGTTFAKMPKIILNNNLRLLLLICIFYDTSQNTFSTFQNAFARNYELLIGTLGDELLLVKRQCMHNVYSAIFQVEQDIEESIFVFNFLIPFSRAIFSKEMSRLFFTEIHFELQVLKFLLIF